MSVIVKTATAYVITHPDGTVEWKSTKYQAERAARRWATETPKAREPRGVIMGRYAEIDDRFRQLNQDAFDRARGK